MNSPESHPFVSRGGVKLQHALQIFGLDPQGYICADLGSHVGGFVDCLLRQGVQRVYAVDTAYGTLAWALRKNSRVVVLERQNAMHVSLPESVDLVTIDVGWTRQRHILPNAGTLLRTGGRIITLIKPHYEADKKLLVDGVLSPPQWGRVVEGVLAELDQLGYLISATCESPIPGHAGNRELLALVNPHVTGGDQPPVT